MAKYPNFGWRGSPDFGCLPTIIIFCLTAVCPPLGLIAMLIVAWFKDNF